MRSGRAWLCGKSSHSLYSAPLKKETPVGMSCAPQEEVGGLRLPRVEPEALEEWSCLEGRPPAHHVHKELMQLPIGE